MRNLRKRCSYPQVRSTTQRYRPSLYRDFMRYQQDPGQGRAIIDTWPSDFRRSAMGREMSCYRRPKVFRKKCLGHDITPSANTAAFFMPGLSLCRSANDLLC